MPRNFHENDWTAGNGRTFRTEARLVSWLEEHAEEQLNKLLAKGNVTGDEGEDEDFRVIFDNKGRAFNVRPVVEIRLVRDPSLDEE